MKSFICYELDVYAVVEGSRFLVSSVSYFTSRKARSAFRVGRVFFEDKPYYQCLYGFATSVEVILSKVKSDDEYIVLDRFSKSF